MNYKKIIIEIEMLKDKKLSKDSKDSLMAKTQDFVDDVAELYSKDSTGFVGSGYNFITKVRDYKIEVGFEE